MKRLNKQKIKKKKKIKGGGLFKNLQHWILKTGIGITPIAGF